MNSHSSEPAPSQSLGEFLGSAAFLEALPVGIYCCDRDGVIRQFNRRAAELWGRTPRIGDIDQRFCGAHRLFLPDGTPLPHHQTPMADVLRNGLASRGQRVAIERPDGSRVIALVSIDPLFDENGDLVGAVNCFQDITGPTRAHAEFERSQTALEDFFENAAIALHIVGGDGTILRANKAELELLGYSASEYIGRPIWEFHADRDVIDDILSRLQRRERLDRYPARLRAKDGSIRHVLITSNAQFHEGEFVQTRCFTFDVTETELAKGRAEESEQRFHDVLEALPAAVYTTDAEGRITFFNRAAAELAGRPIELGHDRWCVTWRLYWPDGTPLPHDQCPMAMAIKEQRSIQGMEAIAERPDGSLVRFLPFPTPLFDKHGRLSGAVNMLVDITDRHKAELESAYLASLVASSDDAIISMTRDGVIRTWNAGATRLYGYEAGELVGEPITRVIPAELHQEEHDILERIRRGEHVHHYETVRLTKAGAQIHVSIVASPVRDKSGQVIGISKVARDITERKRSDQLQLLLLGELNHRVKNTLATIQAIATQTVRQASTPADFVASFSGRIQALAQAHDLLTRNSWQGADIQLLLRDQLLLGGSYSEQISCSGPSVMLDPQPALHLALILHELGTNARKYGALSAPGGRLTVEWSMHTNGDRKLLLRWAETGGPAVQAPSRRGFGSKLIERSLAAHGGEASLSYLSTGVVCEIALPLPQCPQLHGSDFRIKAQKKTASFSSPAATPSKIRGKRVLVIEDEPLIAMDIFDALAELGCVPVGPAATPEQAEKLINDSALDAAFVDASLGGRPVDELAAMLTRRNIPFAFLTGYGREGLPEAFRQALMANKPFTSKDVLDLLVQMFERDESVFQLRSKTEDAH